MKRYIYGIVSLLLFMLPAAAFGQQTGTADGSSSAVNRAATVVHTPRSEWLGGFSGISINGRLHVHLVKNAVDEGPRITYDTKGEASKFKASVDRSGILKVEEPADAKRTTVTEVTIWCNDISSLSVNGADLTFERPVSGRMFDLEVSGGANVTARLEVSDLAVSATGRSSIVIDGSAKYMTLDISTAKFDGTDFHTVSSVVDASHSAEVRIAVSERLQGTTSTSATIFYKGEPELVRFRTTMFGGDITPLP